MATRYLQEPSGPGAERAADGAGDAASAAAAAPADSDSPTRSAAHVDATLSATADVEARSPDRQSVLDRLNDAILTVDRRGLVLSANLTAARLFGQSVAAINGRPVDRLVPSLAPPEPALETLLARFENGRHGAAPALLDGVGRDGRTLTLEATASRFTHQGRDAYVLCLRDAGARLGDVESLREAHDRYRALVEHAPEAIVVIDVDEYRFVDVNENAERLFRRSREALLDGGPALVSPKSQPDGRPSFGEARGHIEHALAGGQAVFDWTYCDPDGGEIPCEVRFVRVPPMERSLIRASIVETAARRRADELAHEERKILEAIVAGAPLRQSLRAVVRLVEQTHDDLRAVVMRVDERNHCMRLACRGRLAGPLLDAVQRLPVGRHSGTCGVAATLGRQVVTKDVGEDGSWVRLREAARASGVQAACSTPIVTPGGRFQGTLDLFFETPRGPTSEELEMATRLAQILGIAVKRKLDESALRDSENRFRTLFDNVVDGVFQTELDGRLISANPALVQMLGYEDFAQLPDANIDDYCVDARDRQRLLSELLTHGRVRNFEYRLKQRGGNVLSVIENSRVVEDETGRPLYCEGTITDITQRKAAERALFKEKERAQVTLKSIGDAVISTDANGCIEYLNPVAEQLTGWASPDAIGQPIENVVKLRDDVDGSEIELPVRACLRDGRAESRIANAALVGPDGASTAIQDSVAPIRDNYGNVVGTVIVFHDVSRERRLNRQLSYYASHDSLTGLLNRREFESRTAEALAAVQGGTSREFALLYLDLDQFKVVNDTCGHAAGDMLLQQLTDVLQQRIPEPDVMARLGGDEFAVLLSDCPLERATEIADGLREDVASFRFGWRDGTLQVGVSIGIVPIEPGSDSVGSLLSAADVACYVAKDSGRNRIHVYEDGDAAERHKEMKWVARINSALEQQRFELHYQAIVPIGGETDARPKFELLLRMRDENGALIMPDAFIPAAERYNLMAGLDRWVVRTALAELVYTPQLECAPYTLALNVSGATLNDSHFLEFVVERLDEAGAPPGAVCFEITETAAIANLDRVVAFMRALKKRGCLFSLDDFGTGLSSLTYLKNLPVDYVKIDGQFIRNVVNDSADRSVVEAVAQLAAALGIKTIAERVENEQALESLGRIGISFAQGYFLSEPRPVAELPGRAD